MLLLLCSTVASHQTLCILIQIYPHTLYVCASSTVAMIDIYFQILHSVKERFDRFSHRAIHISTGKIWKYKVYKCLCTEYVQLCLCACVWVNMDICLCVSLYREITTSPAILSSRLWYRLLAVWLKMKSSVTILLMIQNVGRPFLSRLLVSLQTGLFAQKSANGVFS